MIQDYGMKIDGQTSRQGRDKCPENMDSNIQIAIHYFYPGIFLYLYDMNLSPSNFTGLVVQGVYKNAQHIHLCV
jgi:hypothetical protein